MAKENQNTAPGLDGWMDIFRSGTHTDHKGNARSWTNADLDQIVANTAKRDPAPVIIGHMHETAPAWGWTQKLRRSGDVLQARLGDVHDKFRQAVADNLYRSRSASFRNSADGWSLHHLAFLGANPPSVHGLEPVKFEEDDAEIVSFMMDSTLTLSVEQANAIGVIFRNIRENIIERGGLESADRTVPEFYIELFTSNITSHSEGPEMPPEDDNPRTDAERLADLERKEADFKRREEAHARETAAFAERQKLAEAESVIGAHVTAGRVLPAERDRLTAFMASLDGGDGDESLVSYAEGDGTVRKSQRDIFDGFLDKLPDRVSYSQVIPNRQRQESGTGASERERDKLIGTKARAYRKEQIDAGNPISHAEAVDHIRHEMGVRRWVLGMTSWSLNYEAGAAVNAVPHRQVRRQRQESWRPTNDQADKAIGVSMRGGAEAAGDSIDIVHASASPSLSTAGPVAQGGHGRQPGISDGRALKSVHERTNACYRR